MISFLCQKLIVWIFGRAVRSSNELVYLSIYKKLRSLGMDTTREADFDQAMDLFKILIMPACFLSSAGNVGSSVEVKENAVVSCGDVRTALGYLFSIHWFMNTWVKNDERSLKAEYYESALRVLGIEPLIKSIRDVLDLTKEVRIKTKTLRRELASCDWEEATDAVYSELFPKLLDLNQFFSLFGILSSAYLAGTYIFTHVVFFSIDSEIVGLNHTDYFIFATNHCLANVPLVLLGIWFVLPQRLARLKKAHLSLDLGVKPKQFTSFDALIWVLLGIVNIPAIQCTLGFREDGWQQVAIFDAFLLLLVVLRQFPYERIVSSWFTVHIFVILGAQLMFLMLMTAWNFSEILKQPSVKQWVYEFDKASFTSNEYSLVFKGEKSIVFYHRDSKKLEVMDSEAAKSFSGKL